MFETTQGNILEAPVEALVNTVNTEGVMGKGIALQFKRAYPHVFERYAAACKAGDVQLGRMHVVDLGGIGEGPRWVINFPTKGHWRARSRLSDIEAGLVDLVATVKRLNIQSIAIPPLGCGNGGLDWEDVHPRIEAAFGDTPSVKVMLYAPKGAPSAANMPTRTDKPALTVGRAALIALIKRYEEALLDPFVSLLEIHKLMYFLQEAGQPLRLQFEPHFYGPYATNLRHLMTRLEGHWLRGFGDGSDEPEKIIELIDESEEAAANFLQDHGDVQNRMQRVAELIRGFEDPYGLELLSSIHWVMTHDEAARDSADAAIAAVRNWNARKLKRLEPDHLRRAWERLKSHHWDHESRSAIH